MTAVPNDRVSDYKEALKHPDLSLLQKIEKTLENSPFWIEGNYLASACAKALGYEAVSEAIRQLTTDFVSQFADFPQAKFSNGYAFVPESLYDWLQIEAKIDKADGTTNVETDKSTNETEIVETASAESAPVAMLSDDSLKQCYEEQGLAAVLKQIDENYQQVSDVREKCHLRLEKVYYLMQAGVADTSKVELKELRDMTRNYSIVEWESSLFKKIDYLLDTLKS